MIWQSILPAFFASIVEFVEALTIVLVVGVTINWKSSLIGAFASFLTLALIIFIFGSAIISIDIGLLRLIIGIILILFGLQWLRKSVLRYSGLKALHNEQVIYEKQMNKIKDVSTKTNQFNLFGFLTAYKSVLLEGLEVAVIVLMASTAASNTHDGIILASVGALGAFIVVLILGTLIRKPLTMIPENTLKFFVGIMLVSFGTFWGGENAYINVSWPFSDLFILILICIYLVISLIIIIWLKRYKQVKKEKTLENPNIIVKILYEIFDFFCGDWTVFFGIGIVVALIALVANTWANWLTLSLYLFGIIFTFILSLRFKLIKHETHKTVN